MPTFAQFTELLQQAGTAPGAKTVVAVPTAPSTADFVLLQDVATLDALAATLAAMYMWAGHSKPYDLRDPQDATRFVTDLAHARNYVLTSGRVPSFVGFLSSGTATTNRVTTSSTATTLHRDVLAALFGPLKLQSTLLSGLDGVLTSVAGNLAGLNLAFGSPSQTLDHCVSFYHLTPSTGAGSSVSQLSAEFIHVEVAQRSWAAASSKTAGASVAFDLTMTRTSSTVNSGFTSESYGQITAMLKRLTGLDPIRITRMTGLTSLKAGT